MRQIVISLFILLLLSAPAAALDIPKATGYVNDNAAILSPAVKLKLEQFPAFGTNALSGENLKPAFNYIIGKCLQKLR